MQKIAWITISLVLGSTAAAANFAGTWKLNPKQSPGTHLSSATIKLEEIAPNTYRTTADRVFKSGKTDHFQVIRVYDGQERHVDGDGPPESTEICEITSDRSRKITFKVHGKVLSVITATYSADGNTMTHIPTTDKEKQVEVYEKQ